MLTYNFHLETSNSEVGVFQSFPLTYDGGLPHRQYLYDPPHLHPSKDLTYSAHELIFMSSV